MDFTFTPEQDEAAALAAKILERPRHQRADEGASRPTATASTATCGRELGSAGLLGLALPEEYDGAGLGLLELCRVLVEVGRTVAPVPLAAHGPAARLVAELGSDDQKRQWLPGAATGDARPHRGGRRGARLRARAADHRGHDRRRRATG